MNTSIAVQNVQTVEAEIINNQFSWEVQEKPILTPAGLIIPGYKMLSRSDNDEVLNVCKSTYTPTTNERFCEFVYGLSSATGFEIQNFNEFQGGKKVLAFLKAPEFSVNGWNFENYIAVGNAHDSSKAFFVANTSRMIRCQNQFSSLSERGMKAFHTASNDSQIRTIARSISLFREQQAIVERNFNAMHESRVSEIEVYNFVKHMLDLDETITIENFEEKLSSRKLNQLGDLFDSIEKEQNDLGLTKFALFHGVTRWTTHVRNQKEKTFGNLFGTNAQLNQKALSYLIN